MCQLLIGVVSNPLKPILHSLEFCDNTGTRGEVKPWRERAAKLNIEFTRCCILFVGYIWPSLWEPLLQQNFGSVIPVIRENTLLCTQEKTTKIEPFNWTIPDICSAIFSHQFPRDFHFFAVKRDTSRWKEECLMFNQGKLPANCHLKCLESGLKVCSMVLSFLHPLRCLLFHSSVQTNPDYFWA